MDLLYIIYYATELVLYTQSSVRDFPSSHAPHVVIVASLAVREPSGARLELAFGLRRVCEGRWSAFVLGY